MSSISGSRQLRESSRRRPASQLVPAEVLDDEEVDELRTHTYTHLYIYKYTVCVRSANRS